MAVIYNKSFIYCLLLDNPDISGPTQARRNSRRSCDGEKISPSVLNLLEIVDLFWNYPSLSRYNHPPFSILCQIVTRKGGKELHILSLWRNCFPLRALVEPPLMLVIREPTYLRYSKLPGSGPSAPSCRFCITGTGEHWLALGARIWLGKQLDDSHTENEIREAAI